MPTPPDERHCELADRLYGWRGREVLGARDVVVWVRRPRADHHRYGVAFVGDALKMTNYALRRLLDNYRSALDLSLQRALGLPAEVERFHGRTTSRLRTMDEPDPHIASVLDGVKKLAGRFVGADGLVAETLMPTEGAPYSPANTPTPYYSAKQGKVLVTERPDYLVEVETREGKAIGADFCAFAPRISHCTSGTVVGAFHRTPQQTFLVTHCSPVFDRVGGATPAVTAKLIRHCSGLLFPSLAVGEVPATNFGLLVLVADVSLILPTLRPYKKRGAWPVIVYETDVWTETTHHFLGDGAVELLTELTDISNFMYKDHFWVLGPPVRDADARPLGAVNSLRTKLKRRARVWERDLNKEELEQVSLSYFETPERYAFLEAKVNGVTGMDCYPLAVCPKGETRRYRSFLSGIGFTGELLSVARPAAQPGRDERWDYAWRVRDAILAYAANNPERYVLRLEE